MCIIRWTVTYALEQKGQMESASWSVVPGAEARLATSTTQTFTVSSAGGSARFFRLRVLPGR